MSELRKQSNRISYDISKDYSEFCNSIPNKRILVYIPSGTEMLSAQVVEGIFELLWDCTKWQKYGFSFIPLVGRRMPLPNARTIAVEFALQHDCGYILWLDDDMVLLPGSNAFSNLLLQDKDIVAPLFYTRVPPHLPCIFTRRYRADNRFCTFENIVDYPKDVLLKVDGVGFGCVLTKTEVFKATPKPWFIYSDTFGEDLFFCSKAIDSGVEIYADTSFSVGHMGIAGIVFEDAHNIYKEAAKEFVKQKIEGEELLSKKYELECDIVMPCYKNFEITKKAIESILNYSSGVSFNMILINDGNDSRLARYFERLVRSRPNITTVTNNENIGWIKSVNQGLAKAKTHYVLLVNNDIEIWPQYAYWLQLMIFELMCDDKLGAVGPTSNFVMGLQSVQHNEVLKMTRHYGKFLIGFCMMIKKSVLDNIGGLDERFGLGGEDDLDLSIRIRNAGYRLKILRDVFVHHEGFKSLGLIFKDYKEIEDKLRPLLIEKWGKEKIDDLFIMSDNFILRGE